MIDNGVAFLAVKRKKVLTDDPVLIYYYVVFTRILKCFTSRK